MNFESYMAEVVSRAVSAAMRPVIERLDALLRSTMTASTDDSWMTPAVVAKELSVTADTVREWVNNGKLRHRRIGRGIRISRTDLTAFMSSPGNGVDPEKIAALADRLRKIR